MEVIPQFDFAIINYKIQNDGKMTDSFDTFTYKNRDNASTLLSDTNGINAIAGADLDVWVTFSLDDDENKDIFFSLDSADKDADATKIENWFKTVQKAGTAETVSS